MNLDSHRHFSFNYNDILIDEIALNGLEGICFDVLWKYVEKRISSHLTPKIKSKFWDCIKTSKCIYFYKAPKPLPTMEVLDRFMIVDESSGQLLDPPDYLDGPYEYAPVENEHGSCADYHTRTSLCRKHISSMSYDTVIETYGNSLVMVASLEERWHAIAGHMPLSCLAQLTSTHYCILELIGKARENGQMTIGKSNLTKIVKEPKLLFYNRKQLKKLDLIRVQCVTQVTVGKGVKSLLLRIKRFDQCKILSMPKVGKLHNLIEYLRAMPNYSERCDLIMRRGYLSQPECKKLKKTINIFQFTDKYVTEEKPPGIEKKKSDKSQGAQKRKFITLAANDDESSQSDDENNEDSLECQYKVGVNILRQAYERFIEAGLKGLTQVELAQLVGVEFYTSRTICRSFRAKNIVREFLEDKGRQRTARYIAVAANSEMVTKYAEEKEKLLQNFNNVETLKANNDEECVTDDDMPNIPLKRIKLEDSDNKNSGSEVIEKEILEVKVLDGLHNLNHESLLNPKKSLSLRQLRFANGLFQVIQEKQAVGGYQTLSALVAERIGEAPMDTKALKLFVQKLVTDGQLKILKIKWPGFHQKYTVLICAANVKSTSPVIRAKYKDICLKAVVSRKSKTNQPSESAPRPLSQFAYPRYMKIQKLHELLIEHVYFNSIKIESYSNPVGVSSLLNIIPEMKVDFALGNISNISASDIAHLKVSDELLSLKLRDTPADFYRSIIQSKSMQNSIRGGLKVLAQLGLIQLIVNIHNAKFYVNRNAKIIDTTGPWPRKDTEAKLIEKKFYFATFDDVKNYWDEVYSVCTNTQILAEKRERHHFNVPLRKESEVEKYDDGSIYGDGLGPCGFHSSVYMDVARLWDTLLLRNNKKKNKLVLKKNASKLPKVDYKRRRPATNKKPLKKVVEEPTPTEKRPKVRHSDINIKWSPQDDEILIICKAAITIMSPSSQAGCLKVKNTVARTLLSLKDPKKTGRVCHRRALLIEPDPNNTHKKDCILNELRRHRHLIQKYEDVLRKLKIRYCANMTRYINEGRLVMLELVWIIYQVLNKGMVSNSVGCIAKDYDDFNNKYTITASSRKKCNNLYRTPVTASPELATLKEGILLTVVHSYNRDLNTKTAKKIYNIFEIYSEEVLRTAIEQLRKSSAMAAKEKIFNNQINKVQFNDIIRSSFKISASYRRKWISRLNADFVDSLVDVIETEVSHTGIKGSPGINCAFFEMHSCDVLDIISVTVPVIVGSSGSLMQEEQLNVIDIEMKFKLKSGVAGWKNKANIKKFCELFEDCQLDEHLATLQSTPIVEYTTDQVLDLQDPIVSYLNVQGEKGATFRELQVHIGCDNQTLTSKLLNLEHQKAIKRVGYYENRVVLMKFIKPWLFSVSNPNNIFIIPSPWMTLDLELRHDMLLNWTGVIMNKVFESPGCSVAFLSDRIDFLTTRNVQEACMFLEKCECVKLKRIELREVDLFSDDDCVPEITEFSPYECAEHMLVFPVKSCMTRYAYLRKKILELTEADV